MGSKFKFFLLLSLPVTPAYAFFPGLGWPVKGKKCTKAYQVLQAPPRRLMVATPKIAPPDGVKDPEREKFAFNRLSRKYPGSSIKRIATGGESFIFRVIPPVGEPFLVKFPNSLESELPRLTTGSYEREVEIVKAAGEKDREGSRYLIGSKKFVPLGDAAEGIGGLETEYIPGGSVESNLHLFGNHASDRELLIAYRQIALGVRSLHRAGWIHKDLKPDNIMVRQVGDRVEMVVSDLGLAAPNGGFTPGTKSGEFVGSLDFVSQAQWEGVEPANPNFDLFALSKVFRVMQRGVPSRSGGLSPFSTLEDAKNHPLVSRFLDRDFYLEFDSVDELITAIDAELVKTRH